jgi:hypothetical protein
MRKLLVESVLLYVSAHFVIPRASLFARENASDDAGAAILNFRDDLRRHRSLRDVRTLNHGNYDFTGLPLLHDLCDFATHLGVHLVEYRRRSSERPSQFLLHWRYGFR